MVPGALLKLYRNYMYLCNFDHFYQGINLHSQKKPISDLSFLLPFKATTRGPINNILPGLVALSSLLLASYHWLTELTFYQAVIVNSF